MRSKPLALLLLLACGVALPNCEDQGARIFDVCATLERCTGYVHDGECSDAVLQAIDDRRLTTSAVARCAQCMGDHAPGDGALPACTKEQRNLDAPEVSQGHGPACERILGDRVCDAACADVSFALRARTSTEMRGSMCRSAAFCGSPGSAESCEAFDRRILSCQPFETQLEADADIDACRICIVKPAAPIKVSEGRAAACQLMVDACSEPCRKVAVSGILGLATLALDVCKADACFAGDGNAGGAPGNGSGQAGEGGEAAQPEPCFERVMAWLAAEVPSEPLPAVEGSGGEGFAQAPPELQLSLCATCVADKDCPSIAELCHDSCDGLPLGELP